MVDLVNLNPLTGRALYMPYLRTGVIRMPSVVDISIVDDRRVIDDTRYVPSGQSIAE